MEKKAQNNKSKPNPVTHPALKIELSTSQSLKDWEVAILTPFAKFTINLLK